jgi:dihydroorotate dehydrogenase electron transfer subunit
MLIDPNAEIVLKKRWSDWILFSIRSPKIASFAKPGQFIMVKVNDFYYPLLRRPFSIHNVVERENTPQEIEIFFQIVGEGTFLLAQKQRGEKLNIIGPLGRGFSLGVNSENKKFYLIGGGRGIAPLFYLAKQIKNAKGEVIVFYGGKSKKDLPLLNKFQNENITVFASTEDGSYGWKGLITQLFEKELKKAGNIKKIYSCGPNEMMKKVALIAKMHKIESEFSMESIFGCGIGACWGCVVRVRKNGKESWAKACTEGPVFQDKELIW